MTHSTSCRPVASSAGASRHQSPSILTESPLYSGSHHPSLPPSSTFPAPLILEHDSNGKLLPGDVILWQSSDIKTPERTYSSIDKTDYSPELKKLYYTNISVPLTMQSTKFIPNSQSSISQSDLPLTELLKLSSQQEAQQLSASTLFISKDPTAKTSDISLVTSTVPA
ncbi:unnamed protein product, partial [Protopolystoma xenopodis]